MTMVLIALLIQAAAPAPVPAPEALAPARRLAETGTLATLMPMLIERDLGQLVAENPALTAAQRDALVATGRRIAAVQRERLIDTLARGYARRLSPADLATLAAAADSPAARRKRDADLPVIAETMQALGEIDFKGMTRAQFCKDTGALCPR